MKTYTLITACALPLLVTGLFTGCSKPLPDAEAQVTANTSVGTKIDDSIITTRVKSALLNDPYVKSLDVKVETRKGQVQLSGFVDSRQQGDRVKHVVRGVEGVQGIEDSFTIKEGRTTVGNKIDDQVITTRVKSALLANPNIKSTDISVATRKGEVQLSGYIDNQQAIDTVVRVVSQVEGVEHVVNEMSTKK